MKLRLSRRAVTAPGEGDQVATDAGRERQEIISAHAPCETAANGTGARCTCSFGCANYWLRARGYKQESR
jgi:hypothetical protein